MKGEDNAKEGSATKQQLPSALTAILTGVLAVVGAYLNAKTYLQFADLPAKTDLSHIIKSFKDMELFAWHPLLMTTSALFAAPAAYKAIQPRKKSLKKTNREGMTQLHAGLSFLSALSMALGFYAIYTNKNRNEKPHFQTPHSYAGLAMISTYAVAYLSAAVHVPNVAHKSLNFNWNSTLHKRLGQIAFLASGMAVSTGLYTKFGTKLVGKEWRGALALIILFSQGLIVLDPFTTSSTSSKEDKKGK